MKAETGAAGRKHTFIVHTCVQGHHGPINAHPRLRSWAPRGGRGAQQGLPNTTWLESREGGSALVIRLGAAPPGPAPGQQLAPAGPHSPAALPSAPRDHGAAVPRLGPVRLHTPPPLHPTSWHAPPCPLAPPAILTHMLPFVLAASIFMLLFFHLFPGRAPFPLAGLTLLT